MKKEYLKYTEITNCRACDWDQLEFIFSLGELGSCGYFPKSTSEVVPVGELNLVVCSKCTLVQLDRNFSVSMLFGKDYGYKSNLNPTMVSHLYELSQSVIEFRSNRSLKSILDIGSNDGTFLNFFAEANSSTLLYGCDPAIAQFGENYSPNIVKQDNFFDTTYTEALIENNLTFDLITSIAMFYDLPDPNQFVENLSNILAPDGTWVLELTTLETIIHGNAFDSICHEHLEYYSEHSLINLIRKHGLYISKMETNTSNGGSTRLYIEKRPNEISTAIFNRVAPSYLEIKESLQKFKESFDQSLLELKSYLSIKTSQGKKIYALGASTKGNCLLQYAGIGPEILIGVAEINGDKFGSFTPGTKIPIVSELLLEESDVDIFLVLPWHFRSFFLEKKSSFLRNGGELIFPLPKFEICTGD